MKCPKCHNKLLRVVVSYHRSGKYASLCCVKCNLCSHAEKFSSFANFEYANEMVKVNEWMQSGEWKILSYIDTPELTGLAKFIKLQEEIKC
jgi:transcriptional regulator NrdR family protein